MSPVRRLSDRHPFEIYLLTWAFLVSAPAAIGLVDAPGSVQQQMTPWAARLWAVSLSIGCLVALIGLAWRRPKSTRMSVTGLSLEQTGLVTVGCSTIFYAAAAVLQFGWGAALPSGIVLAFGLASLAQAWKIQRVLRAVRVQ